MTQLPSLLSSTKAQKCLLFLPLLALILTACFGQKGQLKPLGPTATPGDAVTGQPILVTFAELQADPNAYRDKAIRVSGLYYRLPLPDCLPYSGPVAEWSIIAESLRLDVLGFEQLLQLMAQESEVTVDGIFRMYDGPAGCGKGPPAVTIWFLEALRIVQPNPLTQAGPAGGLGGLAGTSPAAMTTPFGTRPSEPTATPMDGELLPTPGPLGTSTPIGGGTFAPGGTPTSTPTATPTLPGVPTASSTPTPAAGQTTTATASPTATQTATSLPGTPTTTPTSTQIPPQVTNPPPLPTATTGGGYPPPSSPTPTASPSPYPGG